MRLVFTALILTAFAPLAFAAKAKDCSKLLTKASIAQAAKERVKTAKFLIKQNLAQNTYVARWKVSLNDARDVMPRQGETLVVGVTTPERKAWMEKIGYQSIGIILNGLPEEKHGSAFLRLGDKFYSEDRIREGREPLSFTNVLAKANKSLGYMEVTFFVSPEEMQAVQDFVDARAADAIKAKFDIRGTKQGEPIHPVWTHTGDNLVNESCAAVVLSWTTEDWLQHYDKADVLRKLRDRLNLNWTYVANRIMWENFRNPAVNMVTLHRIDRSKKDLEGNLLENLSWGGVRGLFPFAFVADAPNTSSSKFESERIPLAQWLGE
jgi:hypothetical protein